MAKYTINYTCGHSDTVLLLGKMDERYRRVAYYETLECPQCRMAKKMAEINVSSLPSLKGSEKQVAWAFDIRKKYIELCDKLRKMAEPKKDLPEVKELLAFFKATESKQDAKFWIENRDTLDTEMGIIRFYKDNKDNK